MADLQQKLESLCITSESVSRGIHQALDQDLHNEKRKTMVFGIVILFMIAYMLWMLSKVKQIDAEMITELAAQELIAALPNFSAQIRDFMEEKIPELRQQLEDYSISEFDDIVKRAEDHGRSLFTNTFEIMRGQLRDNVRDWMFETHDNIVVNYPESSKNRRAELFKEDFSKHYKMRMMEFLAKEETAINEEFNELKEYLTAFRSDEGLTERQLIEKEFVQAVIALVQHATADNAESNN